MSPHALGTSETSSWSAALNFESETCDSAVYTNIHIYNSFWAINKLITTDSKLFIGRKNSLFQYEHLV